MTIPNIFIDKMNINKNNNTFTHLFCIILRIVIGLLIINGVLKNEYIYILSIFIVSFFMYKFIVNKDTWKVYLRTIITYCLVIYFTYNNLMSQAGIVIIVDSLMGLQSRHIFDQLGKIL